MDQYNPMSNPKSADDVPNATASFVFSSLLTLHKSGSGKPVKKRFSFSLLQ